MARCFKCGDTETNNYIGSSESSDICGVLCDQHYGEMQYDLDYAQREREQELDRIDQRYTEYYSEKQHERSVGNYNQECRKCEGTYYTEDYYDSGLCPYCSDLVKSEMDSYLPRIHRIERTYYKELKRIYNRYNLDSTVWDRQISAWDY